MTYDWELTVKHNDDDSSLHSCGHDLYGRLCCAIHSVAGKFNVNRLFRLSFDWIIDSIKRIECEEKKRIFFFFFHLFNL